MPLFWPRHRLYSRDELRYVLGMSAHSNGVSRVLSRLCPGYADLSNQAKKAFSPTLSERALFAKIVPKAVPVTLSSSTDAQEWLRCWLSNAPRHWQQGSQFELLNGEVLHRLANGTLDMNTLSRAWKSLGEHGGLILDAPTIRALRILGILGIPQATANKARGSDASLTWLFRCGCNRQTAQSFATLRQLQNRKSLKSAKYDLVRQHFAHRHDQVSRKIIPEGSTHLQIQFTTHQPADLLMGPLNTFFDSIIGGDCDFPNVVMISHEQEWGLKVGQWALCASAFKALWQKEMASASADQTISLAVHYERHSEYPRIDSLLAQGSRIYIQAKAAIAEHLTFLNTLLTAIDIRMPVDSARVMREVADTHRPFDTFEIDRDQQKIRIERDNDLHAFALPVGYAPERRCFPNQPSSSNCPSPR
ncbi:hypothetical protein [Aeromonas sp. QDB20]|uniref:hypothetical protein n=1 Tax=Aeromonas sp. QDB20 TaxID=2989835 RepID=UPI0022E43ED1|nr:hypothetical protein [Aeromonas sp. QDB20]